MDKQKEVEFIEAVLADANEQAGEEDGTRKACVTMFDALMFILIQHKESLNPRDPLEPVIIPPEVSYEMMERSYNRSKAAQEKGEEK